MRPVERPKYTGSAVSHYRDYLNPLLDAFGPYCSYCEAIDKLDVEHVIPKSKRTDLALDWNNLLLGCPRCNRDFKKSHNDGRDGYLWPDRDDTFSSFVYFPDGRVKVNPALEETLSEKANGLLGLVCLNDSHQPQPARNLARRRKFGVANHARVRYLEGHETIDGILLQAKEGFWSVWMTVFRDRPEVIHRLLSPPDFPGTERKWFE